MITGWLPNSKNNHVIESLVDSLRERFSRLKDSNINNKKNDDENPTDYLIMSLSTHIFPSKNEHY